MLDVETALLRMLNFESVLLPFLIVFFLVTSGMLWRKFLVTFYFLFGENLASLRVEVPLKVSSRRASASLSLPTVCSSIIISRWRFAC